MAKNKVVGKCHICGKEGRLTFEHIPPGATYNKQSVKLVNLMDLIKVEHEENALPWELERAPFKISQRGRGAYCLCEACNNNTGAWYGMHYKRFVDALMYIYWETRKNADIRSVSLELLAMRPLPIIKQVFAMFCDINPLLTDNDKTVRNFLLDKESNMIDTDKFRIFMYLMKGGVEKTAGFTASLQIDQGSAIVLSEIAAVPVGFILYKDLPWDYKSPLTEITSFLKFDYNCEAPITMTLNIYEVNSWIPGDFRSKQEIKDTIEKSKRWISGNGDK